MKDINRIMNIEQGISNNEVLQVGHVSSFNIQYSVFSIQYFFAAFCIFCGIEINAQTLPDTLSLDHLLKLTATHTIQEKEAAQNIWLAEANLASLEASLKPQVSLFGNIPNFQRTVSEIVQPNGTIQFQPISYNNSFAVLSANQRIAKTGGQIFVQSSLQRFDDFANDFTQHNGNPIRVGVFQPLFAFNEWKWDQKILPLELEEAKKKYVFDVEQAKTLASGLFFDLLLTYNDLEIAISNENSIQTLFTIAEERYELGKISERDLIQLEVELASAASSKKAAQRNVKRISTDIFAFLGMENTRLLTPRLPEDIKTLDISEEQALKEMAANRFEFISARIEQTIAERELNRAKKDNGLQVDITASAGYVGSAKTLDPVYAMARDEQAISVQFNIPILDWGQRKEQMKIAKIQKEFTRQKVQQDQLQLRATVRQVLDQFESLQEEVQLAANIQNLASKRYRISTESYVLGAISLTELTLSQREKDQAKRQYISVLSQYWQIYQLLTMNTLYDFRNEKKLGIK